MVVEGLKEMSEAYSIKKLKFLNGPEDFGY